MFDENPIDLQDPLKETPKKRTSLQAQASRETPAVEDVAVKEVVALRGVSTDEVSVQVTRRRDVRCGSFEFCFSVSFFFRYSIRRPR